MLIIVQYEKDSTSIGSLEGFPGKTSFLKKRTRKHNLKLHLNKTQDFWNSVWINETKNEILGHNAQFHIW